MSYPGLIRFVGLAGKHQKLIDQVDDIRAKRAWLHQRPDRNAMTPRMDARLNEQEAAIRQELEKVYSELEALQESDAGVPRDGDTPALVIRRARLRDVRVGLEQLKEQRPGTISVLAYEERVAYLEQEAEMLVAQIRRAEAQIDAEPAT